MTDRSGVVAVALVPGMPHLLANSPAASWKDLRAGIELVGTRFREAGVQTIVVLSTQWFTVLGHQFQLDPNPSGERTDENWYAYDYGTIRFDLRTDVELTERWMQLAGAAGLQTRRTHYEGFPIDTGTVVATTVLDPGRRFEIASVSCNLYAAVDTLEILGSTAVEAAVRTGRRIGVVAVSGLSSGLIQRWIEPEDEAIADPVHDRWNRRMIDALTHGQSQLALDLREPFAREAAADSQFRALAFLLGTGVLDQPADLLAYGSVWGTGAAALYWTPATPTGHAHHATPENHGTREDT